MINVKFLFTLGIIFIIIAICFSESFFSQCVRPPILHESVYACMDSLDNEGKEFLKNETNHNSPKLTAFKVCLLVQFNFLKNGTIREQQQELFIKKYVEDKKAAIKMTEACQICRDNANTQDEEGKVAEYFFNCLKENSELATLISDKLCIKQNNDNTTSKKLSSK
ncbi:hypothetical protein HCN44_007352 [Aphidius gifuensis]|uniref:Odorant-binding protein n=1 Tax=Aphidius gifuensis TaxID=684658 RepID=A0A3S9LWE7_APHGI|nr:uncharacterized protein LOC122857199 [Aphidius gifuensis]AZQ24999.1 odorant-binding protein [Aphidius gifuensis]KAF7989042.1 hypothetical protein HCN44_007352 [Aphidius gifuensis]